MNSFIICELVSHCLYDTTAFGFMLGTYAIRATAHLLASHTLLKPTRTPPNQAISLQGLVILYVLRELAERICPS
jgi:hypothetical protein